jgi:mutator protein MutT
LIWCYCLMDKLQRPIVIALVKNDQGQILIGKRHDPNLPAAHEKWELIGGGIEWDETPEQAVVREVKEESGLDVEVIRLLPKIYVDYWTKKDGTDYKVVIIAYECKVVGGQLHTENFDEKVAELKFISKSEIDDYDWINSPNKNIAIDENIVKEFA